MTVWGHLLANVVTVQSIYQINNTRQMSRDCPVDLDKKVAIKNGAKRSDRTALC